MSFEKGYTPQDDILLISRYFDFEGNPVKIATDLNAMLMMCEEGEYTGEQMRETLLGVASKLFREEGVPDDLVEAIERLARYCDLLRASRALKQRMFEAVRRKTFGSGSGGSGFPI